MPIDGQIIVNALVDAKRRGADSSTLAEMFMLLRGDPPIDILADHVTHINQIIQGTYKAERDISKNVKMFVDESTGTFSFDDIYRAHNYTDQTQKHAVRQALYVMASKGIIEKAGDKNGIYRLAPPPPEDDLDYINADLENHLTFNWPLGIERKTRIFPGSVVILAGVTGRGKTTLLYDFIFHNQHQHKITLFKSEESKESVKYKLSQYEDIALDQWQFSLRRWRGRPDEIDPNGITILDYLAAPPDKPYMIAEPINKIIRKLDQGICIIALQKKPGAEFGTGGMWSAFDTTLNINLEWGLMEITKNRFSEADEFRGLNKRNFDVRRGHIVATSGWYSDGDEPAKPRSKSSSNGNGKMREYVQIVDEAFPGGRLPGDDTEFEVEA